MKTLTADVVICGEYVFSVRDADVSVRGRGLRVEFWFVGKGSGEVATGRDGTLV